MSLTMTEGILSLDTENMNDSGISFLYDQLKDLVYKDSSNFNPHSKQLDFMSSPERGRIILGGNQSGKSLVGTIEALCHATGKYPSWYPQHLKIRQPNTGRIIVSDFSKGFGEVVWPKINEWLPGRLVRNIRKNHEGYPEKYTLINGSSFDICTHQQERDVFEGWVGSWAWFDEPPPRYSFIGTMRGLISKMGRYWMTMTPLSEPWIYDELVVRLNKSVKVFYVDIRDNPFLKEKAILEFEKNLSNEEKEARLHGKFLHLTGLVYKVLNPEVHYATLNLMDKNSNYFKLKKNWYFVLDPHDRRPHCGIWAFIDPMNRKYVAYELFMEGTITQLCAYIRVFERAHNITGAIRIGDPNKLETPTAVTGLKLKEEFARNGIYFDTKIDDDVTTGHLAVKEELHYDKSLPIEGLNCPRIYFSEEVPLTKEMFSKYVYQEWRGPSSDSRNPKETPRDENKDFPDCVRYFVMKRPHYWNYDESNNTDYAFPGNRTGYR